MFPTIKHLEQLAAFASADELLEHAAGARGRPVEPRVVGVGRDARASCCPASPATTTEGRVGLRRGDMFDA